MIAGLILAALEGAAAPAEGHAAATVESANQIVQIAGQFGIKPWLLLAQVINFALVAGILYFFVIRPIQKKLDERAKIIDEGLLHSEESQKILASAKAEHNQIVLDARREAQHIIERAQKEMVDYASDKRAEAQREAAELVENASRSLAAEQQLQIAKAEHEITRMVVALAEKSLEETLTDEQKSRFASRVAESIQT